MRESILIWARAHRRILMLKAAVACALVGAHFFPSQEFGLVVNLVWLVLF